MICQSKKSDVRGPDGWLKAYRENGKLTHTLSGGRWNSINIRLGRESYKSVANQFESFDSFVDWSVSQIGYSLSDGVESFSLDKDILGSHVYSETSCLFVPKAVNNFVRSKTGDLPLGVKHQRNKYRADIRMNGVNTYLGSGDDPFTLHRLWQLSKHELAIKLAQEYQWHKPLSNGLIGYANRIREDYDNGRETK